VDVLFLPPTGGLYTSSLRLDRFLSLTGGLSFSWMRLVGSSSILSKVSFLSGLVFLGGFFISFLLDDTTLIFSSFSSDLLSKIFSFE
jgi:hypothetical protein